MRCKRTIPCSFKSLQWRRCVNQWFTHSSRNLTLIELINTPTQWCHARDNQVRLLCLHVTSSLQWVKWIGYELTFRIPYQGCTIFSIHCVCVREWGLDPKNAPFPYTYTVKICSGRVCLKYSNVWIMSRPAHNIQIIIIIKCKWSIFTTELDPGLS